MPTSQRAMPKASFPEVGADELLANLKVYVTSANWFKYGEKANCPVDSCTLVAHKGLFQSLSAVSANLTFKKSTVKAVFKQIAVASNFPKLDSAILLNEWVGVMTARLRMACRHVAKARTHQPNPPQWLEFIDGPMSAAGRPGHSELYL